MHKQKVTKVAGGDVEPIRRIGGQVRIMLSPRNVDATAGFLATLTLQPEEFVAEQYNPYSDKFLYVVRGDVVIKVDGEPVALAADEALMVRRGQRHRIENHGETEAFLVFQLAPLAPRPELGHVDVEELPFPDAPGPRVGG
ncbi:cupin domain-containing protein [Amycolatopsis balhimycina DSM 5908]|uniref:Cupin domain-containing protein n=1 Tax=Amycolatopsis balhimycina DSM 5908 TaxID=1081091 RepID=A0A428WWI3_AMYBA|nr:cupin domain-containing protein [Amycolatopsis balhimycina]RSM47370.1 cupin domain-containing protein [Amycolatopsis balhimycina DSM 5908]